MTEAGPRGPNQPKNPTVTRRMPVRTMAKATGSIRAGTHTAAERDLLRRRCQAVTLA